eukprot:m.388004 g.388004  ORF g.388004 m.388004 type:complete len:684 (-) comp21041_c0_seq3:33-2084(-)
MEIFEIIPAVENGNDMTGDAKGAVVAVTGASGLLGGAVVKALLSSAKANKFEIATILALDIVAPKSPVADERVVYFMADIQDTSSITDLLKENSCGSVIHCCSVIDIGPIMSTKVYNVNVLGTTSVIQACRDANVSALLYTSSTDVVFDGTPVANGSEATTDYPNNPSEYNGYIFTKSMAEQLVLEADGTPTSSEGTLRTSVIRPGHIYGPGDPMITIVLERVAAGLVPCSVGNASKPAINDYVYVDNIAEAHVQCLTYLVSDDPEQLQRVRGEAFCIADLHANIWDHLMPFLAHRNLSAPTTTLPFWVGLLSGWVVDMLQWMLIVLRGYASPTLQPTRYAVTAISQDFYFKSDKARERFGYSPSVSRDVAVRNTIEWLDTPEGQVRQLFLGDTVRQPRTDVWASRMHSLHLVYGSLYMLVGAALFFFGPFISTHYVGIDCSASKHGSTIVQTAGLITGVLGAYSVTASTAAWDMIYFRLTWFPHFLTALVACNLVYTARLPPAFAFVAVVEATIGETTRYVLKQRHAAVGTAAECGHHHLRLHFDRLSAVQLAHAVLSGAFQLAMLAAPGPTLGVMLGEATIGADAAAVQWGHVMGMLELFMTWTYALSAVVGGLEPFVRLSIITRFGATLLLAVGWLMGWSTLSQLTGVLGDALLALMTTHALRTSQRCPDKPTKLWGCAL